MVFEPNDHICNRLDCKGCKWRETLGFVKRLVKSSETVDAVPVVHGHWISVDEDIRGFAEEFECSVCKRDINLGYYDTDCDYEYCPRCGAPMDEEEGEQDDS